jgi:TatD DNase family protein
MIDSHCHLDFPQFQHNLDEVIYRAKAVGINLMQTISTKLDTIPNLITIAETYPEVFFSVGIHPVELASHRNIDNIKQLLINYAKHARCIGVGETGLDFYHTKDEIEREQQQKLFMLHCEVANESELPIIIHSRDAEEATFATLKDIKSKFDIPILMHCFTGSVDFAKKLLALDPYFSFSGVVTFKNARHLADVVKLVPQNRILVESDAPFLAPVPHRGECNEPSYVQYSLAKIGEILAVDYDVISKVVLDNFLRLFTKATPP